MSIEENKAIVREFFARFSAADVEGALSLLDEGAVWRAMGVEGGLPMSGELDKESIGGLIAGVKEAIPAGLKLTPSDWTAEGDRVALELECYGELTNGRVYNNFYHFLVIVSGGKIKSVREYMDTNHQRRVWVDA